MCKHQTELFLSTVVLLIHRYRLQPTHTYIYGQYLFPSKTLLYKFLLSHSYFFPFILKNKEVFTMPPHLHIFCDINIPMPFNSYIFARTLQCESIIIIFDTFMYVCMGIVARTVQRHTIFRKLKKAPQRPDNMGVVLYWYHSALLFIFLYISIRLPVCMCLWILSCNNLWNVCLSN